MPYIPAEKLAKAKEIDLLTYLQSCEPDNLVKESHNSYCTKEHDSLKISNGLWFWFSQGFGGRTALDYLIKVKGYSLPEAVNMINGGTVNSSPVFLPTKKEKLLQVPQLSETTNGIRRYLKNRGINENLIQYCIDKKLIFETDRYHNVMFAGYDEKGKMRYANLRGTNSSYKGEVSGSDKRYSFKFQPKTEVTSVHLFESAIDLLSYISIQIKTKEEWQTDGYLSLGGISANSKELPLALEKYLSNNKRIDTIYLHLDNDEKGIEATENLFNQLACK